MRVDLLGYLLDALDDRERARVEQALRSDPELQRRLEALQEQLSFLAEDAGDCAPPPGLAERTCARVAAGEENPPTVRPRAPAGGPARRRRATNPERGSHHHGWSLADSVVSAGVFLAAALLFFPAIANSRYRSQITACQYNLQRLGDALTAFSQQHCGLFPQIPVSGKRAAVGLYAPVLIESEILSDPTILICPASPLAQQRDQWWVPTLAELDGAEGRHLERLQQMMGGSYGYTLGYLMDGRYHTPRNESRAFFAVMSDAPSLHLPGHQSSNHGGRGQNVLFEDNHVQFVVSHYGRIGDEDLFLNRRGFSEAGTDKEDAVIGFSAMSPLSPKR